MTPIVIPAYEPDERMLQLLETLKAGKQGPVVIVDDGSGAAYKEIFERAGVYVKMLGGAVLTHEVNCGKGRALKTAFSCILKEYPDADLQIYPARGLCSYYMERRGVVISCEAA